jgi:HK97 gp10 family phage protein
VEEFKAAMQRFDSGMQRQVHRQLAGWAADIKAEAMRQVPVRTGYLRSTIYAKIQNWVAEIGADATYALAVELGTKYMQAQPYLEPALSKYLPTLEQVIVEAINKAATEASIV